MKRILKSLFSMQSSKEHTFSLEWMDTLDQLSDINALEQITQQLHLLANDDILANAERFRVTLIIDDKNRNRLNTLTEQFISFETLRHDLSEKTYNSAYFYHRQIYASYRNLINYFINNPDNTVVNKEQLPLLVGRAMLAIYEMVRWRFFIQQASADNVWIELFDLYQLLEKESLTDATLTLYDNEDKTHLSSMFIQACMLGTLDYGAMTKQQADLASVLLDKWLGTSKPSSKYLEQRHLYYIDLKKDTAAKRIRNFTPAPNYRYWDIDQLSSKIKLAIAAVEDKQPLEYLNLGNLMQDPQLLEVLIMMRSEWSKVEYRRQRRGEDRKKVSKAVNVTYGIDDICNKIKTEGLNPAGRPTNTHSLDDRLMNARSIGRSTTSAVLDGFTKERWLVSDESTSGFGVLVTEELNLQAKVGKIVGLTPNNNKYQMIIGTIRSVKKLPNGHHHIGIKVISRHAKVIKLNVSSEASNVAPSPYAYFLGLYIAVEPGLTIWPSLLLPKLKFQANKLYEIMHADKKVAVQLGTPTESKDDWIKVNWPD